MTKGLLISSLIIVVLMAIAPLLIIMFVAKGYNNKDLFKKLFTIIFTLNIICLVLLICLWITPIKNNELYVEEEKVVETVTLQEAGFNELSLERYMELITSSEKNIILVARPTCSFCEKFSPILKQAADELKLTINYINTDEFSSDDWNTFSNSLEYLSTEDWGTPLTLIVQNKEVIDSNNGYVELESIKSFFKENGLGE